MVRFNGTSSIQQFSEATGLSKIIPKIQRHKSTIAGVASAGLGLASLCVMPPLASAICLGASKFLGGASLLSYCRDFFNKMKDEKAVQRKGEKHDIETGMRNIAEAIGGRNFGKIELSEVSREDRKELNEDADKLVMSDETKTAWNTIKGAISAKVRSAYGKKQDNYDCVYMHGPPGTGKTEFAKALRGAVPKEYELKHAEISAGELLDGGARKLRELKEKIIKEIKAVKDTDNPVCFSFFLDEAEAGLNRDRSVSGGAANEYLTFVNEIKDAAAKNKNVYILGALATNFDEMVDSAAKRDGRVTHNLEISYLGEEKNKEMIDIAVKQLDLNGFSDEEKAGITKKILNHPAVKEAIQDDEIIEEAKEGGTEGEAEENKAKITIKRKKNLAGASIIEAMKNAKRRMEKAHEESEKAIGGLLKDSDKVDEFAKYYAEALEKSAKKAENDRKKAKADLKRQEGVKEQLANIVEAIRGNDDQAELKKLIKDFSDSMIEKAGNTERDRLIASSARTLIEDAMRLQGYSNVDGNWVKT